MCIFQIMEVDEKMKSIKIGDVFGYRTVVCLVSGPSKRRGDGDRRALCRCKCGSLNQVLVSSLLAGQSRSCGCLCVELASERAKKHGHSRVRDPFYYLYKIWAGIIQRCENPNDLAFKNYGARGIFIYPEWRNDFRLFCDHVGHRPTKNHTLDRVDNDRGYIPGNVRWATRSEQMRNARSTNLVMFSGEMVSVSTAAEQLEVDYGWLRSRVAKGMTIEQAMSIPKNKHHKKWEEHHSSGNNKLTKSVMWEGRSLALRDAAALAGIKYDTFRYRMRRGWTTHRAMTEPPGNRAQWG